MVFVEKQRFHSKHVDTEVKDISRSHGRARVKMFTKNVGDNLSSLINISSPIIFNRLKLRIAYSICIDEVLSTLRRKYIF